MEEGISHSVCLGTEEMQSNNVGSQVASRRLVLSPLPPPPPLRTNLSPHPLFGAAFISLSPSDDNQGREQKNSSEEREGPGRGWGDGIKEKIKKKIKIQDPPKA